MGIRGQRSAGFEITREFPPRLGDQFPELSTKGLNPYRAVLVVRITSVRRLNLLRLVGALRKASRGGYRTAVVTTRTRSGRVYEALPLTKLRKLAEQCADLRKQLALERAIAAHA